MLDFPYSFSIFLFVSFFFFRFFVFCLLCSFWSHNKGANRSAIERRKRAFGFLLCFPSFFACCPSPLVFCSFCVSYFARFTVSDRTTKAQTEVQLNDEKERLALAKTALQREREAKDAAMQQADQLRNEIREAEEKWENENNKITFLRDSLVTLNKDKQSLQLQLDDIQKAHVSTVTRQSQLRLELAKLKEKLKREQNKDTTLTQAVLEKCEMIRKQIKIKIEEIEKQVDVLVKEKNELEQTILDMKPFDEREVCAFILFRFRFSFWCQQSK